MGGHTVVAGDRGGGWSQLSREQKSVGIFQYYTSTGAGIFLNQMENWKME